MSGNWLWSQRRWKLTGRGYQDSRRMIRGRLDESLRFGIHMNPEFQQAPVFRQQVDRDRFHTELNRTLCLTIT